MIRGGPRVGLYAATMGFFAGFAAVALFSTTISLFAESMSLGPIPRGLLIASPMLSGSLLRIPFSAWAGVSGGRKPLLVLLGLSIAGVAGLFLCVRGLDPAAAAPHPHLFPALLLAGILSGCGIAIFSVGISQVTFWFPVSRQGAALGLYAGIGNLAPGLFTFLLPIALTSLGLSGAYLVWLFFLVLATVVYFLYGTDAWYFQLRKQGAGREQAKETARGKYGQESFPTNTFGASLRISAACRQTWTLVLIYFTTFGGFIALTTWLPTYWTAFYTANLTAAGALAAAFAILCALARIPGGSASDRWGGKIVSRWGLAVMVAGAGLMTPAWHYGLSIFGQLLMAGGMGVCNAAVFKLVPREIPKAVGGAAGWVGGIGALGGFLLPLVKALFVSRWGLEGYAWGIAIFVPLGVLCLFATEGLKGPLRPART